MLRAAPCFAASLAVVGWKPGPGKIPHPLFGNLSRASLCSLIFQKDEALLLLCTSVRARRKTVCPLQRETTRGSLTLGGLKGDSVICPPLTLTSEAAENASVGASGNNTASVFLLQGLLPCPFYCLRSCSNPGSITDDQLLLCWSQTEVKTNRPLFPATRALLVNTQSSGLFSCGGFKLFPSCCRPLQGCSSIPSISSLLLREGRTPTTQAVLSRGLTWLDIIGGTAPFGRVRAGLGGSCCSAGRGERAPGPCWQGQEEDPGSWDVVVPACGC